MIKDIENLQDDGPTKQSSPTYHNINVKMTSMAASIVHTHPAKGPQSRTEQLLVSLSPNRQFVILTVTMFICFGIHNLLQEAIMKTPGFHYGVMLGYMEVFGVTICSFLERKYIVKEKGRKAPLSSYTLLTFCLMTSSALSNLSLNYINFPTKVIFRSCKLIPTMIIATFVNKRIFTTIEYACAFSISLGLIIFTVVDWKLAPIFHPVGILFVSISVFADAILPNMQEKLFRLGSSRLEVTVHTNFFTLIIMTFTTIISGDMMNLIKLVASNDNGPDNASGSGSWILPVYMVVYTFISYIAVSSFMLIVKKYGGVTAVLLGTARKAMTLILSFCFFPKVFSIYYVIGTVLVLSGLLVGSLTKQRNKFDSSKSKQDQQQQQQQRLLG
jgi:adenosine 3'-phospho 5'-phosphosulfate transporter B3